MEKIRLPHSCVIRCVLY